MIVLPVYIQDRQSKKRKASEGAPTTGTVEIIARRELTKLPNGKDADNDKGDFTSNLCITLDRFVRLISEPSKVGGFKNYHGFKSILDILAKNKNLTSNPRRIWLKRPRKGDDRPIARLMMDADDIRETGHIRGFAVPIQGKIRGTGEAGDLVTERYTEDPVEENEGLFVGENEDEDGRAAASRLLSPPESSCG